MKKILILLSVLSLSIAGSAYMTYDFDETENITLGYNHTFKTYVCEETGKPSWVIAGGVNYDIVADEVGFASVYALPMKFVTDKMAVWTSLGFATVTEGDMDGGLTYGLGLHYYLNETVGVGVGMVNHDWEMGETEDTLEKTGLFFSYRF